MKILVMGDKERMNPLYHFHCRECGCEFIANASECNREMDQYNETIFLHECPCCHHRVFSSSEYNRNNSNPYQR